MSSASTGSLEDQIRQSLTPLGEPLRIDSFLGLMMRERARKAGEEARARQQAAQAQAPKAPVAAPAAPAAPDPGQTLKLDREKYVPEEGENLDDEVKAFMARDEVEDSSRDEVSDFIDMLGGSAYVDENPKR